LPVQADDMVAITPLIGSSSRGGAGTCIVYK
jgi:hypothetical protein